MKLPMIALLLSICAALGRVGENREALIKRLGEPQKAPMNSPALTFKSHGFIITCKMERGGWCWEESYSLESGEELRGDALDDLLKKLADYKEVVELRDGDGGQKRWSLGKFGQDRKVLFATLDKGGKSLRVGHSEILTGSAKPSSVGF